METREEIKFEEFKRKHEDTILAFKMYVQGMSNLYSVFDEKTKEEYEYAKKVVKHLEKLQLKPSSYPGTIINYSKNENITYRSETWIAAGYCMTAYYNDSLELEIKLPGALNTLFKTYMDKASWFLKGK